MVCLYHQDGEEVEVAVVRAVLFFRLLPPGFGYERVIGRAICCRLCRARWRPALSP